MSERWKEMKKRYWPPGKEQLLILVLFGLLLAVIAVPAEDKRNRKETEEEAVQEAPVLSEPDYGSRMEQRLQEILEQVEGVGRVRVMLTFEGSGEKRVEKDTSVRPEESLEETVYEERGSSERTPYVTSETNPRVEGVLVIAEGGAAAGSGGDSGGGAGIIWHRRT